MSRIPTQKKLALRILQILIIAALIYFVGSRLLKNWGAVTSYNWHINYIILALSLVTMLAGLFVQSIALATIFGAFSKPVTYLKTFKIAYLSQLGRYIPGKIWQVFGMVYLAGKEGISKAEAITSFALAQIFATPPAILVVAIYLFFAGDLSATTSDLSNLGYVLGAVIIVSVFILLKPEWLSGIINYVLTRLGKGCVDFRVQKKCGGKILLTYFIGWNLLGLSFYLFLVSVSDFPTGHFLQAIGIFCAAYLIGYWSILTPGGFGVREAVLILLLDPYFSPGVAAAIAAFARLWSIVGEVIASLAALKVK